MKLTTYLKRRGIDTPAHKLSGFKNELQALPTETQAAISEVHRMLKDRTIHPSGTFDKAGRFTATNSECVWDARTPSRAWPYSEMTKARSKKYVLRVAVTHNCRTMDQLKEAV